MFSNADLLRTIWRSDFAFDFFSTFYTTNLGCAVWLQGICLICMLFLFLGGLKLVGGGLVLFWSGLGLHIVCFDFFKYGFIGVPEHIISS